jgi:arylformamidase
MKITQVIDLSHPLRPGEEARTLEIKKVQATQITGAPSEEGWYIMHQIVMDNHMGTHLEVPYHILEDGVDLGRIPAERFIGEGVILDLKGYNRRQGIPLSDTKQAAENAGGIRNGDIVFINTGWSRFYGAEEYLNPPYLSKDALIWILSYNIKILGLDTPGSMDPNNPDRENHLPIMQAGVIYIENLTNLDSVPQSRVLFAAQPPAIHGLDGVTIRVVAIL